LGGSGGKKRGGKKGEKFLRETWKRVITPSEKNSINGGSSAKIECKKQVEKKIQGRKKKGKEGGGTTDPDESQYVGV